MQLTISPMTLEHLEGVLDIEVKSFSVPSSKKTFEYELIQNNLAYYWVALLDSKVVGYVGVWLILDEAHIINVAVSPEARGKNLGKILMLEAINQMVLKEAKVIWLEVRPSNIVAYNLYNLLGFKMVGLRKEYYSDNKEDALVMAKYL